METRRDRLVADLIKSGYAAVEELIKVAEAPIITNAEDDPTAEKLKTAAQAKKIAIVEAFDILQRIKEEEEMIASLKDGATGAVKANFAENYGTGRR